MSPTEIAAWCLVISFASLLVIALGGNHNIVRELKAERAARNVAEAAYRAEARAHERTVMAWANERPGFARTAAEIKALDEWSGR